jgi:hypothetical protein
LAFALFQSLLGSFFCYRWAGNCGATVSKTLVHSLRIYGIKPLLTLSRFFWRTIFKCSFVGFLYSLLARDFVISCQRPALSFQICLEFGIGFLLAFALFVNLCCKFLCFSFTIVLAATIS